MVRSMQIPFMAYAEDCTVRGEIALRADRLADLLASTSPVWVESEAVLVNTSKIDVLEAADAEDLGLAARVAAPANAEA
jgi:hypothetical protein